MTDEEFLEEYLLDSKEQLESLNQSLLELEKEPQNQEAVNTIFRAAHTLKGNSATMGFMTISTLAHKMENLLNQVRDGNILVTSPLVDLLFEALDALESMVENVTTGKKASVCDEIIKRLEAGCSSSGPPEKPKEGEIQVLEKDNTLAGEPIIIVVTLSEKTKLKDVRSFMVLNALKKIGTLEGGEPDLDSIEKGEFERSFKVFFKGDPDVEELKNAIQRIPDVKSCEITLTPQRTPDEKPEVTRPSKGIKKPSKEVKSPAVDEIQSIRVNTQKLDSLVNLVGELVIAKSRLHQIAGQLTDETLDNALSNFERLSKELQDTSMSMRMVKVAHIFDKFPRMVRDLARKEGKEIDFLLEGKDIELDRTVLDKLGEPLVHILRNCVDHGIEGPDERIKQGKPGKGVIRLNASRVKDHVEILIEDDGKGIDPIVLKESAVKKGFMTREEAEGLSDEETIELIFSPGFSGAKEVTDVSGRGVGMDVVKTTVSKLGGSVEVRSLSGKGSTFILRLPLSLAIIKALLIGLNRSVYAIPLKDVAEVVSLEDMIVKKIKGQEATIHRGKPLGIIRIGEILGCYNGEGTIDKKCIIVEKKKGLVGLAVERIITQEEIVVKPLKEGIQTHDAISGATILGDGRVALIIDVYNI